MKPAFWARRAHKWIGLVVGVQALLWMLGGVYMTVVPLQIIHGDHLTHAHGERLQAAAATLDPARLHAQYPGLTSLRLKRLLDREVYEVRQQGRSVLVDAADGRRLSPLPRETVTELARRTYQGEAEIAGVEWLTRAPQEVARRPVPMWAVRFADSGATTLYFSPDSGELLARRHELWRWFDFVWMLHIMDYQSRTDVNNNLLRIAASVGLLFALSGAWLLLYSFRRRPA
jgi:hypothetical protein